MIVKKHCLITLLLSSLLAIPAAGQDFISEREQQLITNWEAFDEQTPLLYDQIMVSEYAAPDLIEQYRSFFETHRSALQQKIRNRDSDKRKARKIFEYLHEEVFKRYRLETNARALINSGEYNCVTATAFFVSMAEAFELPYAIYETPQHVYASIMDGKDEVVTELTAPRNGFDFKTDIESVINTLVDSKLITQDELDEKGPEQLYREYVRDTKPVSKKELLAIQYYNDGLILIESSDYEEAHRKFSHALKLYHNPTFIQAFTYLINISQFDFSVPLDSKLKLLETALNITRGDSLLSYTLLPHVGERIEDLSDKEEDLSRAQELLDLSREQVFDNETVRETIRNYQVYIYRSLAQIASLKGDHQTASLELEKAIEMDPDNERLKTYYVSVTANHALKLAQFGLTDAAYEKILQLARQYPDGYPVINDARVQIILAKLTSLPPVEENAGVLIARLEEAKNIQPENIYLKSFAANTFHELAMQQIRRANYQQAKDYILMGLSFHSSDPTLRSDLELINKMID